MAVKSIQYNNHTMDINYEIINPHANVDLIVLHGWGSNKEIMKKAFSPYMSSFRHIYIDLPGFGKSTCNVSLKTEDYARIIELFLIHLNASVDIILGHSFGGKIALLLEPQVLVLVASAGIYLPKPITIKLKIAFFKLFKMVGLSNIRSLFIAQDAKDLSKPMYETFKNVVDEDFSKEFSSFTKKALLCWGKDDTATPLSSAKKMHQLIKGSTLEVYDGDHFFFMDKGEDIADKIKKIFLKTLEHR